MRLSAAEKARSACPTAGITTVLTSVDPASVTGSPAIVDRAGGAQDIVGGDAAALARQFIAAARAADALENADAHQRLQDRFEMTGGKRMSCSQRLGRHRPPPAMERDVDDGGDCE